LASPAVDSNLRKCSCVPNIAISTDKIGLKELWWFKRHRTFDTANVWTIAGGAMPEDWPDWMRNFKDY